MNELTISTPCAVSCTRLLTLKHTSEAIQWPSKVLVVLCSSVVMLTCVSVKQFCRFKVIRDIEGENTGGSSRNLQL